MAENENDPKIGAGHASGMARLGLHELRQALYPDSNVAQQHGEYGIYGNSTPQQIVEAQREEAPARESAEAEPSVLADRLRQAEARDDHERESKDMERE